MLFQNQTGRSRPSPAGFLVGKIAAEYLPTVRFGANLSLGATQESITSLGFQEASGCPCTAVSGLKCPEVPVASLDIAQLCPAGGVEELVNLRFTLDELGCDPTGPDPFTPKGDDGLH
jgi:hypothetical protein